MRKHLTLGLRYLHGALIIVSLATACSLLTSVFGAVQLTSFFTCLSILLPFFVSGIANRYARGVGVYLLASLGAVALTLLIPMTTLERILTVFISVIVIIIRMVARLKEAEDVLMTPGIGGAAIFIVLYIAGLVIPNQLLSTVNYYLAFAYAICLLIFTNFRNLDRYLDFNHDVQNIPTHQISRTNSWTLALITGLTVVAMIVLPLLGIDSLIKLIGKGLLRVLQWIFGGSKTRPPSELPPEEIPQEQDFSGLDGFEGSGPTWLTTLMNIAAIVLFVLIGIAAVAALVMGIIHLVRKYYKPLRENADEQEFILPEDSKETVARKVQRTVPLWRDLSPNGTVRRIYRRAVEKKRQPVDSKALTPAEIEDLVGLSEAEHRSVLHELYEKARYSENGCDRDDIRRLRKNA